ncbi:hypothetical protein, partial [Streptomyces sp. SID14478]|uniref:hypothetical protein n=1 Tax=Streptomyces sp. SID14478 TaxID=2706073 RepID=UPI00194387B5
MLLALSALFGIACFLAFTAWIPSEAERAQDYRAARPCPAGATPREVAAEDCLTTWHFTVVGTRAEHGGKTTEYDVTLKDRDDPSWRETVEFEDSRPLYDTLDPGDRVTATGWRHDVVALARDGVRQHTTDEPRDEIQMNTALGVVAALLAAQMFVFGAVRLVRPRHVAPFVREPYGTWLVLTVLGAGFVVGLASVVLGLPSWSVYASVPAAVCAVMLWLLRRRRPEPAPAGPDRP